MPRVSPAVGIGLIRRRLPLCRGLIRLCRGRYTLRRYADGCPRRIIRRRHSAIRRGLKAIGKWLHSYSGWSRTATAAYSASSTYQSYFLGSVQVGYASLLWMCRAPLKENIFSWIALRNRCWTSDRLSRRRLPGLRGAYSVIRELKP
jgi:hypothetical protein